VEAAEGVLASIENRMQYSSEAAEKHRKEREQVEARAAAAKSSLKVAPFL